ncbi:MAG: hypothetical protein LC101_08555 [Flavobacteriales bacterium]|nr:hypothetical protein [Flavobacteriales bacterium]
MYEIYDDICMLCEEHSDDINEYTNKIGEIFMVCIECANSNVFKCAMCHTYEIYDDMKLELYINEYGGVSYGKDICIHCIDKDKVSIHNRHIYNNEYTKCPCTMDIDFRSMVWPYKENVLAHCKSDADTNELFGIEIEVGTKRANRMFFNNIVKESEALIKSDGILKYDVTIDNINELELNRYCGFEIVTRPMNYKNAKQFLKRLAKGHHPLLRSWEVGTTGIHIHVNKKFLRPIEIGKILLFINSTVNKDFIIAIAGRSSDKYAAFTDKKVTDYSETSEDCHYYAVNVSNKDTVEFRIFKGSLNERKLLVYLDFVESLIEFVKVTHVGGAPISSKRNQLIYRNYINWLNNTNRSQYRELKERIIEDDIKNLCDV